MHIQYPINYCLPHETPTAIFVIYYFNLLVAHPHARKLYILPALSAVANDLLKMKEKKFGVLIMFVSLTEAASFK